MITQPSPKLARAFLFSALLFTSVVEAHDFKLGEIRIEHPFARATVAQQTSGGAYVGLENTGKVNDKLIKAESDIAKSVQLHTMEMVGSIMKMREVDHIDLNAGSKISMKPGDGYHIMLMGLNRPLNIGDQFPLTLSFEKAGKIQVTVNVEAAGGAGKKSGLSYFRE